MSKCGTAIIVLGLAVCAYPAGHSFAQEPQSKPKGDETPTKVEATQKGEKTREELLENLDEVHGKRGRRLFRTAYWAAGLQGDMRAIYDSYGYPSSRYREVKAGVNYERWTYLDAGKQFIFRDGRLIRTREFNPGSATGISLK
jgi:hypothetical protein